MGYTNWLTCAVLCLIVLREFVDERKSSGEKMSNEIMSNETKKADPTAIGIFAYGFSLFVLSLYAAGAFPWSESILMIAPALAFGGVFLLIASVMQYNAGNTFGATAFAVYSAFFLTFGVAHIGLELGWAGFTGVSVGHMIGLMALAFVFMTFIFFIGSLRMDAAHALMLFFLFLVFMLYAIPLLSLNAAGTTTLFGAWSGAKPNPSLLAAGYVGLIDCIFTTWIAAAVVINERWEKAGFKGPIPLFPLGKGRFQKTTHSPSPSRH